MYLISTKCEISAIRINVGCGSAGGAVHKIPSVKNVCFCSRWLNPNQIFTGNSWSSTMPLTFLHQAVIKTYSITNPNLASKNSGYMDISFLFKITNNLHKFANSLQFGILCLIATWCFAVLLLLYYTWRRQENVLINIRGMCQINAYLEYLFAQSNDVNIWLTSSEVWYCWIDWCW